MAQLGRILGDYQLLNELGRGGMGAVYKANDYRRDSIVAMKVLPAELAYTQTFMQRFEREIQTLQRLTHPNIVQMYDTGEAEDVRFYCMEYVDGGSVEDLLAEGQRLSVEHALDIAYQVAEALEYAHAQGVVHRDIKPANILRTHEGTVKLTDFGVAKVIEATQATVTSGVVGTIEYLAPEQASGGAVTPATDIYSLGATLYEMLTGRPPFEGDTPSQILHKQLHSLPEQPKYLRPEIPERLNDLVLKMLEKQPERRITSAQALKRELERVKVQLALVGQKLSTEALRQERDWRDYVPAAVGVALLLVLALFLYRRFRPATAEELLTQAKETAAANRHEKSLDLLMTLRDRYPGRWTTEAEQLWDDSMRGLRGKGRGKKGREIEVNAELRLAQAAFLDGEPELALDRCRIILSHYDDFTEQVEQARELTERIKARLGGQDSPEETPTPAANP